MHGDAEQDEPETLDLRGLKCPLPVLRTRRALRRLASGRAIVVYCTDPLAGLDIPNLVRETGDALVEAAQDGTGSRFVIRKARRLGQDSPAASHPPPGSNADEPALTPDRNSEAPER